MGYAKIIKGVSFAAKNLGQVTPVQSADLDRIEIVQGEVVNNTIRFDVNYISVDARPVKTEQKGVTWSIVSGEEYATINEYSGVLTIKEGASNSVVAVKAVSSFDSSVSAQKVIEVTYIDGSNITGQFAFYSPAQIFRSNGKELKDGDYKKDDDINPNYKANENFVDISNGSKLTITTIKRASAATYTVLAFYDSSKECTEVIQLVGEDGVETKTFDINSNRHYVRCTYWSETYRASHPEIPEFNAKLS